MAHVSKAELAAKQEAAKLEVKIDQEAMAKQEAAKVEKDLQNGLKGSFGEIAEDQFGRVSDLPDFETGGLKGEAKRQGEMNGPMHAEKGIELAEGLLEKMQEKGIDQVGLNASTEYVNKDDTKTQGYAGIFGKPFIETKNDKEGYYHSVGFSIRGKSNNLKLKPTKIYEKRTFENGNTQEIEYNDAIETSYAPGVDFVRQVIKDPSGKIISIKTVNIFGLNVDFDK